MAKVIARTRQTRAWTTWILLVAACATADDARVPDTGAGATDGDAASATHDGGTEGAAGDAGGPGPVPNPALLVAIGGSAEVTAIDPTTESVVRTFPLADDLHPHHLDVSHDGARVLVSAIAADFSMGHAGHASDGKVGHSMVYLLHVDANVLEQVIDVPATSHNAAFLADDQGVVLAMAEHALVHSYEAKYFSERWSSSTGAFPLEVTVSKDGRFLLACNSGDDTVSVIDLDMRAERNRIDVPAGPVGAWRSFDGSLWVTSEAVQRVSLLAEDLEGVAATIEVMGTPGQAFETPDASELWVAIEDRGVIAVYDTITHDPIAEFSAGNRPHGLAFEPSGTRAFVTDEAGGRVLVVDVAAHAVVGEVAVGDAPNGIAWVEH
jgi:YVTN family beta-propeller protein